MLNQDFKEFIQSLNDSGARYLVVGGYAVAYHGHPRYTRDLDGVSFTDCYDSRVEAVIDEVQVLFIDLPHLKKNKETTGRHQDLADLEHLD